MCDHPSSTHHLLFLFMNNTQRKAIIVYFLLASLLVWSDTMITYSSDFFGLKQLQIWHGSAVLRAIFPAMFSTGMLTLLDRLWAENDDTVQHPYALTVFIAFFSFLLAFRLNYSYQRVRTFSYSAELQLMLPPSFSSLLPFHSDSPVLGSNHASLSND